MSSGRIGGGTAGRYDLKGTAVFVGLEVRDVVFVAVGVGAGPGFSGLGLRVS